MMNNTVASVKNRFFSKPLPVRIGTAPISSGHILALVLLAILSMCYHRAATAQEQSLSGAAIDATPAEQTEQDLKSGSDYEEGDRVFVLLRHQLLVQTLSRQQQSLNYSTVLSAQQSDRFGDRTLEDGMGRFPGVQVDRRGRVNIRGVGLDRYAVILDNQRVASSGLGDRSVDLSGFSADMVGELELVRVLTPDMDADGLAGVVRLHTRRRVEEGRHISALLGGGGDTRYFSQTGVSGRAFVQHAEALREDLSLSASLSWQHEYRPWETLGINYEITDFGSGPVDVIEAVSPALHTDERNRIGGMLQMDYLPSDRTRLHVRGLINHHDRDLIRHRNRFSAGGDWFRPDSTGATGRQGSHIYDVRFQESSVEHYLVQAGAEHFLDWFDLRYTLGWAQTRSHQDLFEFPFVLDRVDYAIDMSNPARPNMQVTTFRQREDGTIDQRRFGLLEFDRVYEHHVDNTYSIRLDGEAPFGPVSLKVGSSLLLIGKQGDYQDYDYRFIRRMRLDQFQKLHVGTFDVLNQYYFPNFVNAYSARLFYSSNKPTFVSFDTGQFHERSDIYNYTVSEWVYAGYGMATLRLGSISLTGGARVEHTDSRYEGKRSLFNDQGSFEQAIDTSQNVDYTHLFPHLQLGYAIGEGTRLHIAYSRSIARPDFYRLAPFELLNLQDSTLFRGNPHLDPMTSDNLDVWFEHYISSAGVFSLAFFHKQLENFVYIRQQVLQQGEYGNWQERKYQNSDETATLYGVEVSWQQRLDFLPGILRNLGAYGNYTWSQSSYKVDYRDDEVALPGQSPHVVNAALFYDHNRFSTQVSFHWTAESLSLLHDQQSLIPSVGGAGQQVYKDRYTDGWTDLSVSFRFRISQQFRFWADVYNLIGRERLAYEYDRDRYPVATDWIGGRTFRAGIRFDL